VDTTLSEDLDYPYPHCAARMLIIEIFEPVSVLAPALVAIAMNTHDARSLASTLSSLNRRLSGDDDARALRPFARYHPRNRPAKSTKSPLITSSWRTGSSQPLPSRSVFRTLGR
jgi:hypothetical protein